MVSLLLVRVVAPLTEHVRARLVFCEYRERLFDTATAGRSGKPLSEEIILPKLVLRIEIQPSSEAHEPQSVVTFLESRGVGSLRPELESLQSIDALPVHPIARFSKLGRMSKKHSSTLAFLAVSLECQLVGLSDDLNSGRLSAQERVIQDHLAGRLGVLGVVASSQDSTAGSRDESAALPKTNSCADFVQCTNSASAKSGPSREDRGVFPELLAAN
jgi:hypothetical protein